MAMKRRGPRAPKQRLVTISYIQAMARLKGIKIEKLEDMTDKQLMNIAAMVNSMGFKAP